MTWDPGPCGSPHDIVEHTPLHLQKRIFANNFTIDRYEAVPGRAYNYCVQRCVAELDLDAMGVQALKIPDGPWQWFKVRHMPRWFKKKFPVVWRTIQARAFFPEIVFQTGRSVETIFVRHETSMLDKDGWRL